MMRRWGPQSLFGRLLLVWVLGLALVAGVAAWVAWSERSSAGRIAHQMASQVGMAREIAATADWLDTLSPDQRDAWVHTKNNKRQRWRMAAPDDWSQGMAHVPMMAPWLPRVLGSALGERPFELRVIEGHERPEVWVALRLDDGAAAYTRVSLRQLLDGAGPPPYAGGHGGPDDGPARWMAAVAVVLVGVVALTWLAVVVATRPLRRMTQAAHDLALDPHRPPMAEEGPAEVKEAAAAFNAMQREILAQWSQRTQMLAAISHDLQTPLTRMRLRTEWVDNDEVRDKLQADLTAMEQLVKDGLQLAKSWHTEAPKEKVDLVQLIGSLVDEGRDMAWPISWEPPQQPVVVQAQPQALKRALNNVLHNAVKYGQDATLNLTVQGKQWTLTVDDHGPGLPDELLDKVLEPYVRAEPSRNRETGGTGLGLAIARNLLQAQGARIALQNRPTGGLRVVIEGVV